MMERGNAREQGKRKKEKGKEERQTKSLTDPGSGALWPMKSELFFFCCDFGEGICQMKRGGHLCVTPGHAILACRETVRPRGAAFSSCSSLSQREVFFCLFNVLWMPSSVARKLPQEHATGRQCMCIKSACIPHSLIGRRVFPM